MNSVNISGRLTRDPEIRKTTTGKSVCSFTVAVDKKMSKDQLETAKQNGEPTADFISCVAWNHDADYLSTYGQKGNMVEITGRIQTRNYDDKDGKKVYVTEVVAADLKLIRTEPRETSPSYLSGGTSYTKDDISQDIAADPSNDDLPF